MTSQFATIFQYLSRAKAVLSPGAWDHLMGGSETETTLNRNRRALDSLAFRPRVLREVAEVDVSTTLFGLPMRLPVILAPMGSIGDIIADGAAAPTRAAAQFGCLHMMSSSAKPGIEAVAAAAPGYPKLFQLYIRGDAGWIDTTIKRAIDNGFGAIAITVDMSHFSRRERDLARDHVISSGRKKPVDPNQSRMTWKDVERIRSSTSVPLMLKGLSAVEDALLALDYGIDAIYVSNHGGRGLDHAAGSVSLLPEIVEAVGRRAKVIVDGSMLRGSDIVKALALGADAVGMGRLQGIALAAGGDAALVHVLELLEAEMRACMGLLGVRRIGELGPQYVMRTDPLPRRNWIESAFPLLAEGYGADDLDEVSLKLPGEF